MANLTKNIGTVTLTGTAEKVTLPASYGWVWVKNMSEGDIFAGLSENISEGADGVMVIPSGECGRIQADGFSSVYLLGSGNALVVAQNYADCPFKAGGKGGELPVASIDTLGGVMVDGTSITADEQGVISAVGSGGGLEFIGEYYVSSSTGLTTIISKADYKEGDIYLILVRQSSNSNWAYGIYTLIALPTSSTIHQLYCVPSSGTGDLPVAIRIDSAGLSVSDQAYYKLYKMKVG